MAWKKSTVSKSVYRRQLAARLRELREDAELTLADVARLVEVSQGSLSRIETGDRGTTPLLVKALLDCYEVSDTTLREDLLDLVRADQAQKRPWWKKYATVVNTTQYGGYLTLESSATSLRTYQPPARARPPADRGVRTGDHHRDAPRPVGPAGSSIG